MTPENVIYTDGRDVTVTDSTLKVKNTSYLLRGITKLNLWTIKADRWPGILLMLVGIAGVICGLLGLVPSKLDLRTQDGLVSANTLALWIGAALTLIGILITALARDRYAVRIGTAEGERNAVVSDRREYIAQIVDALNRAFNFGAANTNTYYTDTPSSTVIR